MIDTSELHFSKKVINEISFCFKNYNSINTIFILLGFLHQKN